MKKPYSNRHAPKDQWQANLFLLLLLKSEDFWWSSDLHPSPLEKPLKYVYSLFYLYSFGDFFRLI
ncbi:MAG: hypothetical protein QXF26_07440, partial [Candidatus Bathyarchaeia archaeon]